MFAHRASVSCIVKRRHNGALFEKETRGAYLKHQLLLVRNPVPTVSTVEERKEYLLPRTPSNECIVLIRQAIETRCTSQRTKTKIHFRGFEPNPLACSRESVTKMPLGTPQNFHFAFTLLQYTEHTHRELGSPGIATPPYDKSDHTSFTLLIWMTRRVFCSNTRQNNKK